MPTVESSTRIGPYEVIEAVHEGAFSVIYRCRDDGLSRELAVKAARTASRDGRLARASVLREARVRGVVAHPHVLPLHRLVQVAGNPMLVAPWLTGGSLDDLAPRALAVTQVVELAEAIGAALDALHAAGWRHGDVSADNVLFATPPGGATTCHPVLADLGSAARIGARAPRRSGLVLTPLVSAPEVWDGRAVDGRADLYSLGALLYHALTGEWPFEAADAVVLGELHRRAAVPLPSARTAAVGPAVDRVLLRALSKCADRRYSTGASLASSLRDAVRADGLVSVGERARRRSVRARPSALAAAGEHLERFATMLDDRERVALSMLLCRSAAVEARAHHDTNQFAMRIFGPPAALLALEDCGAAAALAAGLRTPAEIAAACEAPEQSISRLLELLSAVGLLSRDGDGYRLLSGLGPLYADPGARPLRDAASFWARLSQWAATGEPFMHMDSSDGATYATAIARAGIVAAPAAQELAEALVASGLVPDCAKVLDIGAGSCVWSLAVAAAVAGSTVVAVDRPLVLDRARANAEAAGLSDRFVSLAGDWRDVSLAPSTFDLAILANICHLERPNDVACLLRRVRLALRPGGVAVVVDRMPPPGSAAVEDLLQTLSLALRTPGGGVHGRASYCAWLSEADFNLVEARELSRSNGALTALVARRGAVG